MSESKRHHFVPQSILRRFAASGSDKGWVYDKQTGASFASSVLQTGMERGFNVVVIDGKRINLEGDFNDVDGRMADLHTRLVDSRRLDCLSTDDRNHLADAAAVLLHTKMLRSTVTSPRFATVGGADQRCPGLTRVILPKGRPGAVWRAP